MTHSYWVPSLGLELCLVKKWRGKLHRHGLCLHGIQNLVWGVGNRQVRRRLQCKVLILELVGFCVCWVTHRNLEQRTVVRGAWALEFQTPDLQPINVLTLGKLLTSLPVPLLLNLNEKRLNKHKVWYAKIKVQLSLWPYDEFSVFFLLPFFFAPQNEAETQSHYFFRFSNFFPGTLGNENTLILDPVLESKHPCQREYHCGRRLKITNSHNFLIV